MINKVLNKISYFVSILLICIFLYIASFIILFYDRNIFGIYGLLSEMLAYVIMCLPVIIILIIDLYKLFSHNTIKHQYRLLVLFCFVLNSSLLYALTFIGTNFIGVTLNVHKIILIDILVLAISALLCGINFNKNK